MDKRTIDQCKSENKPKKYRGKAEEVTRGAVEMGAVVQNMRMEINNRHNNLSLNYPRDADYSLCDV